MFGKIIPYVLVGFIQATLIIGIGVLLFGVPVVRQPDLAGAALDACSSPPISRSATPSRPSCRTSCRRCSCSMMFFLPSILLSGFMFPFAGMPVWAQYLGEGLPLTHYVADRPRHHAEGRDVAEPAI